MSKPFLISAVFIMACGSSWPAGAHETGIYEALEHIHIGRVFLSPPERLDLDKNRNVTPSAMASSSAGGDQKAATDNSRAAGYIVSGSGRARVWKDGDFVAADVPRSIRFPGDVKVTRVADQPSDSAEASSDKDESPAAGAADDAN